MPVGQEQLLRLWAPEELMVKLDAQIYCLKYVSFLLRPGTEMIAEAGGLAQIYELGWTYSWQTQVDFKYFPYLIIERLLKKGALFRSHLDGSEMFLSPEKSIDIQDILGSDIIMAFDECIPYPAESEIMLWFCWKDIEMG